MKRCGKCQEEVPRSEFFRNKSTYDGLQGYCKPCWSEQQQVWNKANSERLRPFQRTAARRSNARKAGMSSAQLQEMWERCGGRCEVCGQPERLKRKATGKTFRLVLDHCHRTGTVRGFLCFSCNVALGCANDNPAILRALADYLERHITLV